MLGWINDCAEKLIIHKFGLEAWHTVKSKAKCYVEDGGFLKLESYSDQSTIDLVVAASEVSGLTVDQVLEALGEFWAPYVAGEGYENLLWCQGSTFKDWLTNINAIHSHLQTTFPNKMTMPEFWVEMDDHDESIILYYLSSRGNLLAPIAEGIVKSVAKTEFELNIIFEKLTTQGVDGAKVTSWRITTEDPLDMYKLTQKKSCYGEIHPVSEIKCPFTGVVYTTPSEFNVESHEESRLKTANSCPVTGVTFSEEARGPMQSCEINTSADLMAEKDFMTHIEEEEDEPKFSRRTSFSDQSLSTSVTKSYSSTTSDPNGGLSARVTKKLFPYHITLGPDLCILQVGKALPKLLNVYEDDLLGMPASQIFEIQKPAAAVWSSSWLRKLEDQSLTVKPTMSAAQKLVFKGSAVRLNDRKAADWIVILCPDANNLDELRDMELTLSDLPVHGSHRDAVFLREHLSSQMNDALKMEKLSKSLQKEKKLLESLLPEHAAEGLRMGRSVEPRLHNNVTVFFSDIVGFTNICDQIFPWEVINMLNQLYCIMDCLAMKFNLFKVETIGDAYVCCSGLPDSDENHARNVANFALAVSHCCGLVKSPMDGKPIQLRIGIHSGSCASGVVGVTNPRYCVFGDTINTTARHESTGEAGKVHCSEVTRKELERKAPELFAFEDRGLIEMKGKGQQNTHWLYASEMNEFANQTGLKALVDLVKKDLTKMESFKAEDTVRSDTQDFLHGSESPLYSPRKHIVRRVSATLTETSTNSESSDGNDDMHSLRIAPDLLEKSPSTKHIHSVSLVHDLSEREVISLLSPSLELTRKNFYFM
ncbi:guanylate cyclase soluble subunit beta [Fistulifera solaris]|uniref:guanylate cyclase n=1 Tax=Fistulifera solaris TaxID=1519565 RepID=A0A1Z5JCB6_FISSO|nr:guanylate cyclase soluble subunit beta [Fistulifera solaris]|eukprot:GAX11644.1 guanylate cyclase soluble subunit beta [Fistulifera solaris]